MYANLNLIYYISRRAIVTEGTGVDCSYAKDLIENFEAEAVTADRGYGTEVILEGAEGKGMIEKA